jgi:hypothetical protein
MESHRLSSAIAAIVVAGGAVTSVICVTLDGIERAKKKEGSMINCFNGEQEESSMSFLFCSVSPWDAVGCGAGTRQGPVQS